MSTTPLIHNKELSFGKKIKAESLVVNSVGQRPTEKDERKIEPQRGVINVIINH